MGRDKTFSEIVAEAAAEPDLKRRGFEGPPFVVLDRVPIRIGPMRSEGALEARHIGELSAPVPTGVGAPIGVSIDAALVLDALADGTLFYVEILAPRRAWRRGDSLVPPRAAVRSGSVIVDYPGPINISLEVEPQFIVNGEDWVHIQIEPADEDTRWVQLSIGCFALANDRFLAGFVAYLPR
jgi:hypothetical protein